MIDTYDEDVQVNDDDATNLINQAAWRVHLGTVEGYRYPSLLLDLRHAPHQAQAWLLTRLGGRIDVTNLHDVRAQHPLGTVAVLLEGHTQTLNQVSWMVETNCSPAQPWRIGVIAADTGDTGEHVLRVDTDGSCLVDGVPAGATSLTVATTSGGIWTTLADDFPLTIDLGGIPVTVTAITGASSPQTFTVTGSTVTVTKPGNTPVRLWRPPVVGLARGS